MRTLFLVFAIALFGCSKEYVKPVIASQQELMRLKTNSDPRDVYVNHWVNNDFCGLNSYLTITKENDTKCLFVQGFFQSTFDGVACPIKNERYKLDNGIIQLVLYSDGLSLSVDYKEGFFECNDYML